MDRYERILALHRSLKSARLAVPLQKSIQPAVAVAVQQRLGHDRP